MVRQNLFKEYHCVRYRDHFNGVLQYGREIRFNSKNNKEKREFMAKKQCREPVDGKLQREYITDEG